MSEIETSYSTFSNNYLASLSYPWIGENMHLGLVIQENLSLIGYLKNFDEISRILAKNCAKNEK